MSDPLAEGKTIHIQGARVHNLKNISVDIPHNQLVVITGLSGSGKSTLAFDTLFAEGQRRYVESLSAYARQFLGRINKPDVDAITGIAPAIAIEQKVNTRNPRSTVGTTTEIYDYLKLLFARIGRTFSPVSGQEVTSHTVEDVVEFVTGLPKETRVQLLAPIVLTADQGLIEKLTLLVQDGFSRLSYRGEMLGVETVMPHPEKYDVTALRVLIDRFTVSDDPDLESRVADSVQTAFSYGAGVCEVLELPGQETPPAEGAEPTSIISAIHPTPPAEGVSVSGLRKGEVAVSQAVRKFRVTLFSNRFEADGITFEKPEEYLFSFNNPLGACPRCEGYGKVTGIDENLVVPDKSKSIYDNAIACWRGETMKWWRDQLVLHAAEFDFPIHRPYYDLTREERQILWRGNTYFHGLDEFFRYLEGERYKIQYRVMLSRYTGKTTCPDCGGARLRPEALCVKVGDRTIAELAVLSVTELSAFFTTLVLTLHEQQVGARILTEIKNRLQYLLDVGLGYLTLGRLSSTLSGGESQRINLSRSLGSSLVGSLYILDEPSIGLHPRDTHRLIHVLKQLRDIGNTVIVVEHEEEIIRAADTIIDIGPRAGYEGGEVVYAGPVSELAGAERSLTASYLTGKMSIPLPEVYRTWNSYIRICGARENNLKNVDIKIPLGIMTCVTGVSGSGKSSLVKGILYPALRSQLYEVGGKPGNFDSLDGDIHRIKAVELVDQNPIGKSSRSNPVTYIKAYDEIRKLFSEQAYAKQNGFTPSHFSFNIAGGRCEECQGEGVIKVEMQFMADVELTCEACCGRRFKDEILEVNYHNKSIYDVLEMTVDDAVAFFGAYKQPLNIRIVEKLKTLQEVGLGYIRLGQSSSTLSGGESQRVKLASFLLKENATEPILFIFDEPTTGLHFHDINKLMHSFNALLAKGHTIVVVEHNMEVIRCADWVIDLGPEGGDAGGDVVFEGTPRDLEGCAASYTGCFLKRKAQQIQERL